MKLSYFPQIKVVHTSKTFHGQLYVPLVNWLLMIGTVLVAAIYNNVRLSSLFSHEVPTNIYRPLPWETHTASALCLSPFSTPVWSPSQLCSSGASHLIGSSSPGSQSPVSTGPTSLQHSLKSLTVPGLQSRFPPSSQQSSFSGDSARNNNGQAKQRIDSPQPILSGNKMMDLYNWCRSMVVER